jgi:hypothetical protein
MSIESVALQTIIDSYRSLADQLENLFGDHGTTLKLTPPPLSPSEGWVMRSTAPWGVFDPETEAPVKPSPHPDSEVDPEERQKQLDWCGFIFFGRLRALNVRQGRGADESEQRAIGRAAGYVGRTGFNGWPWTWEDHEDGRWITDDDDITEEDKAKDRISGMAFLRHYAKQLKISLPDDLV